MVDGTRSQNVRRKAIFVVRQGPLVAVVISTTPKQEVR